MKRNFADYHYVYGWMMGSISSNCILFQLQNFWREGGDLTGDASDWVGEGVDRLMKDQALDIIIAPKTFKTRGQCQTANQATSLLAFQLTF